MRTLKFEGRVIQVAQLQAGYGDNATNIGYQVTAEVEISKVARPVEKGDWILKQVTFPISYNWDEKQPPGPGDTIDVQITFHDAVSNYFRD